MHSLDNTSGQLNNYNIRIFRQDNKFHQKHNSTNICLVRTAHIYNCATNWTFITEGVKMETMVTSNKASA